MQKTNNEAFTQWHRNHFLQDCLFIIRNQIFLSVSGIETLVIIYSV